MAWTPNGRYPESVSVDSRRKRQVGGPPRRRRFAVRAAALVAAFVLLGTRSTAWASEDEGSEIVEAPDVVFEEDLGTVPSPVPTVPDPRGVTGHLFFNTGNPAYLFALRDSAACALPEGTSGTDGGTGRGVRVSASVQELLEPEWQPLELSDVEVHYAAPDDLVVEIREHDREFGIGAVRVRIDCLNEDGEWEEAALSGLNLRSRSQGAGGAQFFVDPFPLIVEDGVIPLVLNTEEIVAGDQTTPVMSELRAELDGVPMELTGTGNTGQALIPEGTEPGLHTLTLIRDHEFDPGWVDVPVIHGFAAGPVEPAPAPVADDTGVPRVEDLRTDPTTLFIALGVSASAAVGLGLMMGFPSDFFNKSVEANQGVIRRWWRGFRALLTGRRGGRRAYFSWSAGFAFLVFWVLAAALPVLWNWNPAPEATPLLDFAGLLIAVLVVTVVYAWVVNSSDTAWSGVPGRFEVLPIGLAIVALCSLVSAALDFQPGYFYGLIAAFAAVSDRTSRLSGPAEGKERFVRRREGRATFLGAVCVLIVSVCCYMIWDSVTAAAQQEGAPLWLRVLDKALFATLLLGVQTIVFGLFPVKFLDGHRLWLWGPFQWGLVYLPGAFVFVYLMHMHAPQVSSPTAPDSLATTLALFAGFGLLSLAVWLLFYLRSRRDRPGRPGRPGSGRAPAAGRGPGRRRPPVVERPVTAPAATAPTATTTSATDTSVEADPADTSAVAVMEPEEDPVEPASSSPGAADEVRPSPQTEDEVAPEAGPVPEAPTAPPTTDDEEIQEGMSEEGSEDADMGTVSADPGGDPQTQDSPGPGASVEDEGRDSDDEGDGGVPASPDGHGPLGPQ